MGIQSIDALFEALLATTSTATVREILEGLGDHADITPDEKLGKLGLQWHAFNDSLSNFSTIGLGTKPGRSLTERLTNAMDAVLETRAKVGTPSPSSCREAAKQWFGRPVTGPDEGLFNWNFSEKDYDRQVELVLQQSGLENAPTVDVIDHGVGIRPEDFRTTILSLVRGNKLTKLYLIGAFGQGGAATLAFADYTIIFSRAKEEPGRIGFTVIRVLRLGEAYKEDAFVYLAQSSDGGAVTVPSVQREGSLKVYSPSATVKKLPELEYGALVRHIGYKSHGLTGSLSPSTGNLYHYLHTSMFDPLLPFRLIDLRDAAKARDELVTGNRNRLMRLVKKSDDGSDGRVEVKHYRPMEYITPHGSTHASIGIEYWVVFAYRKAAKKDALVLRPSSNELFAQLNHPIIGTLNGQNQGELTSKLLREVGLSLVSRHIIVHIDASQASSQVRRELFSTNREGFKDGDVLTSLTALLKTILDEDEDLDAIELELTERMTRRETDAANKEVQEQITKLLLDAGLKVSKEGAKFVPGSGGEPASTSPKKRSGYKQKSPLPTLPFPNVTKFAIVVPRPQMDVRKNDQQVVLVETDADAQFDVENRIALRVDPAGALEVVGKAPLRGGRIRWRLRPAELTTAGTKGTVHASITRPDGTQLTDKVDFVVLPELVVTTKKEKGLVPPFRVVPISPDDVELWGQTWPDLQEGASEDKVRAVAYKPIAAAGETIVYYSTVFGPYQDQLEALKSGAAALASLFETAYQVWIGYHAILQQQAVTPEGVEDEVIERIEEDDRVRVAKMQVKQALQTAKLRQQLMKSIEDAVTA
jgi:hypothetical protein